MEGKNSTFTKIKEWIKNHIAMTAVIAGVFVIVLATVIIVAGANGKSNKDVDIAANATTGNKLSSKEDTTTEYNETEPETGPETEPETEPEIPTDPVIETIELESYTVVEDDGTVQVVKTYVDENGSKETEMETLTGENGDVVTVAPTTTAAPTVPATQPTTTAAPTVPATTAAPTQPATQPATTAPAPTTPSVEIKNGTVVKINGTNGVAVIPSTYDGKAVTTIPASVVVSSSVKEISIPSSITTWEEGAFKDNTNLTKVTVDSNAMPDRAFARCTALTTAEIGSNCKSITIAAFGGCSSLNTVKIGRGVTSIGDGAFCGCISLKEVYIPKNVTTLASFNVFDDAWAAYTELTGISFGNIQFGTSDQIKGKIPNIKLYFEGSSINFEDGFWGSTEKDATMDEGTTNTVSASNLDMCLWGCDSIQRERFTVKFGVAYPY